VSRAPTDPVTLVVDAANVVGSRPDGWWRDRPAAARRLRVRLAALPGRKVSLPGRTDTEVVADVVLVVEGAARRVADESAPAGVRVVAAARTGDDEIVAQAAAAPRRSVVVTADAALRERVRDAGARVVGPRWLWDLLDG